MAKLTLLSPGLYDVIVDVGRLHSRSRGVPVSGAADSFSLAIGNALVGNPPMTPALEITLNGPTLIADESLVCVVYGAEFDVMLQGRRLTPNCPFLLPANQKLSIRGTKIGARAYLCVRGGLFSQQILGSYSSVLPLGASVVLSCSTSERVFPRFPARPFEWNRDPKVLRVLPGGQREWFDTTLDGLSFSIAASSNRMGLRLTGPKLSIGDREMISEPVCPGTVQVTREGQGVILGIDGQTIGGYPKIAQLASVDIDKLGQLRPGQQITFQAISLAEAEQLFAEKRAELQQWLTRIAAN